MPLQPLLRFLFFGLGCVASASLRFLLPPIRWRILNHGLYATSQPDVVRQLCHHVLRRVAEEHLREDDGQVGGIHRVLAGALAHFVEEVEHVPQ